MIDKTKLTPALRQFVEAKEQYKEHILFFRMGDFYEMFFDDAVKASSVLEIALTKRGKGTFGEAPMCGIPYHAYEHYASKLLKAGYKVAICEQVEDPKKAKGVVKREVVKILTPSTSHLSVDSEVSGNFLCSLFPAERGTGLVIGDPTTGDCEVYQFEGENAFKKALSQIMLFRPKEIVCPFMVFKTEDINRFKEFSPIVNELEDYYFSHSRAEETIKENFNVSTIAGFGLKGKTNALNALAGYFSYLEENYKTDFTIKKITLKELSDHLIIDSITRKNLDLFEGSGTGKKKGSLLWALDKTLTPMGKRKIVNFILFPLKQVSAVEKRLAVVEWLLENRDVAEKLAELFNHIGDVERILTKVSLGSVSPVELNVLKESFSVTGYVKEIFENSPFVEIYSNIEDLQHLFLKISSVIASEPPAIKGKGMIANGVDSELDSLREVLSDVKGALKKLELQEQERTGIQKLKVKYNKVFGYYIEISKANLTKGVPENYDRKQTLVNAERFITPELKEFEEKVLSAEEKIEQIELRIFDELLSYISSYKNDIFETADTIAYIDTLLSFATVSFERDYVKPEISNNSILEIIEGKHPVVELFEGEHFVPNDTLIDETSRIGIITGPNMGGKSTYLRQTALIVLMAQIGCFVPAKKAKIGLADRIFSRVGSSDNLIGGQSTFMVEMVETANILNNATDKSLVILDEVGRGTATFDGLSLAWAITEYLAEKGKDAPRTLFATHYHELTDIDKLYSNITNYNVVVKEWNNELMFLRKVVKGAADKSYGIQVARLAGLPEKVIERAFDVLKNIEKNEFTLDGEPKIAGIKDKNKSPKPLLLTEEHPVLFELKEVDINNITPLQALNILDKLKKQI